MKKHIGFYLLVSTLITAVVLCGCSTDSPKQESTESQGVFYQFTDSLNRQIKLTSKPESVAALMGSYAELWRLAGGELLGVTEDALSERNMELSDDIQIIGTVKEPNLELILNLKPDFVILSTDIEAHVKLSDTLTQSGIIHAFFKEDNYMEYVNMLKVFTDITGKHELFDKYGTSIKEKIEGIIKSVPEKENPKVLLIRTLATKAKALKDDHLVGIMLKDLKTDNITSRHESLLEDLSLEVIIEENPDFIFVVTMGDVEKGIKALESGIMSNPAWNNLEAVKNNNYYVLPKNLFQFKPNALWGDSYEYLAEILYK